MSLLQENIVYILLIPVVLQIVIPLVLLVIYVILFPFYFLFKSKRSQELKAYEEFTAQESLA